MVTRSPPGKAQISQKEVLVPWVHLDSWSSELSPKAKADDFSFTYPKDQKGTLGIFSYLPSLDPSFGITFKLFYEALKGKKR